jgi:putative tributyrin esterase
MASFTCHYTSKVLEKDITLSVILPDGRKEGERFRTLYLLHGYSGDHTSWIRQTSIERYAQDKRIAVVMPDVQNSYYADMAHWYPYFTFMTDELVRLVHETFPLSDKPEDTFVAGLSMGGYGAFKWALTYPGRFNKAASLSGALDVDEVARGFDDNVRNRYMNAVFGDTTVKGTGHDLRHLITEHKKAGTTLPGLFVGCGTEDFLYGTNRRFVDFLTDEGIPHTYRESNGAHTWDFWDTYITYVLDWMFPNG